MIGVELPWLKLRIQSQTANELLESTYLSVERPWPLFLIFLNDMLVLFATTRRAVVEWLC